MALDESGGLFSESLNLWFRWERYAHRPVRLLRPYLPDGTPITTSTEEEHLRLEAQAIAAGATERHQEAEIAARAEAQRRQEAEAELEQLRAQLASIQDKEA